MGWPPLVIHVVYCHASLSLLGQVMVSYSNAFTIIWLDTYVTTFSCFKDKKWYYCDTCDRITASAKIDTQTGQYVGLDLDCPFSEPVSVNLTEISIDITQVWIEENIVPLCRKKCSWFQYNFNTISIPNATRISLSSSHPNKYKPNIKRSMRVPGELIKPCQSQSTSSNATLFCIHR